MLITDHLKDRNAPDAPRAARTADPRVLIADDQADVLEALRLLLKDAEHLSMSGQQVKQIAPVLMRA